MYPYFELYYTAVKTRSIHLFQVFKVGLGKRGDGGEKGKEGRGNWDGRMEGKLEMWRGEGWKVNKINKRGHGEQCVIFCFFLCISSKTWLVKRNSDLN